MRVVSITLLVATAASPSTAAAFTLSGSWGRPGTATTVLGGYLDDLSNMQKAAEGSSSSSSQADPESREATRMAKDQLDRFGVGSWDSYVEFNEFDGGDGQMGVAGDGKKGLEKEWKVGAELFKSKSMSAKNAWGRSTGYAEELKAQGVEATRAQQMENWMNQQEVLKARNQHKWMTDNFDQSRTDADEDWRKLSKFGVERTQQFDMDQAFGEVVPGVRLEGIVELSSRINQAKVFEFSIKNPFMGFSDFRARFTPETSPDWTISPAEGSLNGRGKPTEFTLKFRPSNPGVSEGYLVVQTEDEKWTWKLFGTGSM